jgi:hypothetical protein
MTVLSSLRLARLQNGFTLDDLFLLSDGKLSPARMSRIERGLCATSAEESALLVKLLGVTDQTVKDARSGSRRRWRARGTLPLLPTDLIAH